MKLPASLLFIYNADMFLPVQISHTVVDFSPRLGSSELSTTWGVVRNQSNFCPANLLTKTLSLNNAKEI